MKAFFKSKLLNNKMLLSGNNKYMRPHLDLLGSYINDTPVSTLEFALRNISYGKDMLNSIARINLECGTKPISNQEINISRFLDNLVGECEVFNKFIENTLVCYVNDDFTVTKESAHTSEDYIKHIAKTKEKKHLMQGSLSEDKLINALEVFLSTYRLNTLYDLFDVELQNFKGINFKVNNIYHHEKYDTLNYGGCHHG